MENIDIPKLVADIKICEKANRTGWYSWCEKNGIGRRFSEKYWSAPDYADYVTPLYTLRAWLRGRMHRKNPPAPIRDYNRTMEHLGESHRMTWDMEDHNQRIAESISDKYTREEAAE